MKNFLLLLFFLTLTSCDKTVPPLQQWQEMCGRVPELNIYRAKIPENWFRKDSLPSNNTIDSICEFYIKDSNIRITVHNFPSNQIEERIPPMAQVMRWKRQFEQLDGSSYRLNQVSHGGFYGFSFQGVGEQKGESVMVLAWIMQMDSTHYRNLSRGSDTNQLTKFQQMRSDYTIKAVGSPDLMTKHKQAIMAFAKSFELIEEIPTRL